MKFLNHKDKNILYVDSEKDDILLDLKYKLTNDNFY